MNIDDLSDFALVATHGGFAEASRASGRPKASLSRKVMDLEASLGVRLLERGSRSVQLTREGEVLFARTGGPLGEIAEVAQLLRDGLAQPQGRLRLSVPSLFGLMYMGRLAADFKAICPEVLLDITLDDREVNLVQEGYDVVVRVNPKPDSALVGSCFLTEQLLVVAAPSLADPSKPAALTPYARGGNGSGQHSVPVVVRSASRNAPVWHISSPVARTIETRTVLELPVFTMVRDAVLTGIGAARLPRLLVTQDVAAGRLVSWGLVSDKPAEVWALHTSRRLVSARVKAFMQFLKTAFTQD